MRTEQSLGGVTLQPTQTHRQGLSCEIATNPVSYLGWRPILQTSTRRLLIPAKPPATFRSASTRSTLRMGPLFGTRRANPFPLALGEPKAALELSARR